MSFARAEGLKKKAKRAQFIAQSSQGKLADVILEHSLITNESINASK